MAERNLHHLTGRDHVFQREVKYLRAIRISVCVPTDVQSSSDLQHRRDEG
jgi:hypothetical protein